MSRQARMEHFQLDAIVGVGLSMNPTDEDIRGVEVFEVRWRGFDETTWETLDYLAPGPPLPRRRGHARRARGAPGALVAAKKARREFFTARDADQELINDECSIYIDSLVTKEPQVCTPCGHLFCRPCLRTWIVHPLLGIRRAGVVPSHGHSFEEVPPRKWRLDTESCLPQHEQVLDVVRLGLRSGRARWFGTARAA